MPDPASYPGPHFWQDVRREIARTRLSSVEVFDRDEMPLILMRFSIDWNSLEYLDDDIPQARFAFFDAAVGYRFVVTGYRWAGNVVELIEFEIVTWEHPNIEPG